MRSGLDNLSDGLSSLLGNACGAGSDLLVSGSVESFKGLATEGLVPLFELLVESLGVLRLELVEVFLDVDTEDVFSVLLGIEVLDELILGLLLSSLVDLSLLSLDVHTWESSVRVRDVESPVAGSLHGTEDTVTSGGGAETDIEESLEGSSFVSVVGRGVHASVNLLVTWEHLVHALGDE